MIAFQQSETCLIVWKLVVLFFLFFFFWVTSTTKVALRNQTGVSEFLLSFSEEQYCSPSYLGFSSPCAWTLYLEICSSSWLSAQIPTSTPPCTSSFLTCPLWTSVSPPPPSQRCMEHPDTEQSYYLWSLYHPGVYVCVCVCVCVCFVCHLQVWMTSSCQQWPMTTLWTSATPCTRWSSWTPSSVEFWFWLAGSSVSCVPC